MKRILLSIAVAMMCALSANAKVVLTEDFSAFASGSDTAPDMSNYMMDLTGMTQTPGWSCMYVCQAGGSAYLPAGGNLITPALDLSAGGGSFVVTFKAKSDSYPAIVLMSDMYMSAMGYVEITSEWKEYSITLNNGSPGYQIAIQALYSDFYIDDIVVDDMGVDIPVALPSSNFTKDSFTANWQAVGGAVSYLLDVYTLEYNYETTTFDPVYLFKDKEVEGTSYVVTEGEFDVPYYYEVAAKSGNSVSQKSARVTVFPSADEVAVPVAYDATSIEADKFTAAWSASDIATKYYLSVTKLHTAVTDEVYAFVDTDFSEITDGTLDAPRKELEYLFNGDWTANMPVMAEGAVGINNQDINFFGAGCLVSPMLNLAVGDGKINVSFKALARKGMAKGVLALYNYDSDGNVTVADSKEIALTEEWVEHDFVLEGATGVASTVVFTSEEAGMMFIDDLKATVNLAAGSSMVVPVRTYDVAEQATDVTDLKAAYGDKLYYYVTASWAVRQQEGVVRQIPEVMSAPSNVVYVELPTSVEAVGENCAAQVAVQGRTITVTASGTDVAVYTVDGKAVVPSHAVSGDAAYSVQAPGVYLVVAGNKLYKVAVK